MSHFEYLHQNASGGGSIHQTLVDAFDAQREHEERRLDRTGYECLEPPPPPSVGVFRREVTEWEPIT